MKNNYTYPARITRNKEGFVLQFLDFPEVVTASESEEELIEASQEVLALLLLDYIEQGKELPKAELAVNEAVYINVWLPFYKNTAKEVYVKKTVTIPEWLDILAKENKINFSACLVKGIKDELGI